MEKFMFIAVVNIFLISCNKNKEVISNQSNPFQKELIHSINYVLDSIYCRGGKDRMLQVRYQKYDNKDFIQVASVYDYSTDSLFHCTEYKNNLVVFYNKEYFEKKINQNSIERDTVLKKYENFNSKYSGGVISEKRCFEIFQIQGNQFLKTSHDSFYYNNLFANPPMLEPAPPPTK
ncbi:hypothetical protein [Chryseobacterium sp. WX]|uniref:hypothetical protein n=1 Tax=Chryseobacterium sp. WX TaxID=3031803 RepID=UPI002409F62D|nr:hypothetical protein [Chryseobacterium sp. WX]WFB65507.1 hypothetical protein PZ898_12230 [Chryseobacterium sp. WX]